MRANPATWRWALAGALLAAAGMAGCKKKAPADLVLVSPHNKKIEAEFERAFRAWHRAQFAGADVKFEWRDVGGTTTTTKYLLNQYGRGDTSGIDLYFGGGAPDHRLLTARGVTVAVKLPADITDQLPETIGGVRQYDADGRWHGAAISCFGILYHARLLTEKHLPLPKTWDDLADPRMRRLVGGADGSQSGSARAAYEMIVQSAPDWPAGWAKLLAIYANCKHYPGGASDLVGDVANGEVLAGTAIDFYAYDQIAATGDELGFTVVAGTTAFTPDPISLLKGAPHPEMAKRFIEFVLSEAGQKLWCLPPGTPGGPHTHALYRQPVRRDIYTTCKGQMLKPLVDPFEQSGSFKLDEKAAGVRISRLHGPLMKAAAIDNKDRLAKAWAALLGADRPAALMKEFVSLPPDLADEAALMKTAEKLSDPKQRELITSEWQRFFRAKYEKIVAEVEKAP